MLESVRADLDARFRRTIAIELGRPHTRPADRPLALTPALRESMVGIAALEDGTCPSALVSYYTERMPAELVDQMFRASDAGAKLLVRRLELSALPRLDAALKGLFAALAEVNINPLALLGAASPAALLERSPTLAKLHAQSLFGSGLPLVGVGESTRALLCEDLAEGRSPDEAIDLRLSGHILHELCHGLHREMVTAPPPWHLAEAAALHLGHAAFARHIFPEVADEAIPGVAQFVLIGEVMARLFGPKQLWMLSLGCSAADSFGVRCGRALDIAGWQDWRLRRQPPFAADALGALSWAKLVDATRGQNPLSAVLDAAVGEPTTQARALPILLEQAAQLPWQKLPWFIEPPTSADLQMLDTAVRSLFIVHRIAPTFQTHPAEPPGERLHIDLASCQMAAEPRHDGVFAEPASWLFPPPLARRLFERGAKRVRIEGASRSRSLAISAALRELCNEDHALPTEVEVCF